MKKIRINKFKDYSFSTGGIKDIILSNIDFLHPKPLFILLLWYTAFTCFFSIQNLKIFLPLLAVYFYNQIGVKTLKNSLILKRKFKAKGKEEDKAGVEFHITNPFGFNFSNCILVDHFEGHLNKHKSSRILHNIKKLPANKKTIFRYNMKLNNGMGHKAFGPISLIATDEIGLNVMQFLDDKEEVLDVYPKVYPGNLPETVSNPHSVKFGLFDTHTRGENVNFYGTREYQPGDNVKRINWKLSLKSKDLIINEFEKNTNSDISILFFNDERLHTGLGANSSFEYCKDLILTLCHHHINSNNAIALQSLNKSIKSNSGKSHLRALELQVAEMKAIEFENAQLYGKKSSVPEEVIELQKRVQFKLDEDSNLYIFSGMTPGRLWKFYTRIIIDCAKKFQRVHLVLVCGLSELLKESSVEDRMWMSKVREALPHEMAELDTIRAKYGMKISFIDVSSFKNYQETIKDGFKEA